MAGMEWLLELALIGLLLATLFHAMRLERALGVLKRDRAALEELVSSFNASTRAAEQGIGRLKDAADGAGRHIARQVEVAGRLKDDLVFLGERGDALADRLDQLVRAGRSLETAPARPGVRPTLVREASPMPAREMDDVMDAAAVSPRLRSQAERDLMRALRIAR